MKIFKKGSNSGAFLAGILVTLLFVVMLFIFTGRIFLEIFEWLLIPFPQKLSYFKKKKN